MHIYLKICGLVIDFDTRYPEYVRKRCPGYIIDPSELKTADSCDIFHFRATDEEIEKCNVNQVGEMEAEFYSINLPLSEKLPGMGRLMTHGVAVGCDGKSYIFTAKSGVGKSTHAFLWQKYLGSDRVKVINGDKPILWFREDGEILACGSPWNGKEHLDENVCLPLGGICLLSRLESDPEGGPRIAEASREETLDFLLNQIFIPYDHTARIMTFRLLDRLYEKVPFYNLITDMSREGVMVSSGCLIGNSKM